MRKAGKVLAYSFQTLCFLLGLLAHSLVLTGPRLPRSPIELVVGTVLLVSSTYLLYRSLWADLPGNIYSYPAKPLQVSRQGTNSLMLWEHPMIGEGIVQEINLLHEIAPLIRQHHEHMDGKGYPDGLSDEKIPLGARILAVVVSYDAMRTDRPYCKGLSIAEAEAELERHAGTQFDREIVYAFLKFKSRERSLASMPEK